MTNDRVKRLVGYAGLVGVALEQLLEQALLSASVGWPGHEILLDAVRAGLILMVLLPVLPASPGRVSEARLTGKS
jgi:hypothetical protein